MKEPFAGTLARCSVGLLSDRLCARSVYYADSSRRKCAIKHVLVVHDQSRYYRFSLAGFCDHRRVARPIRLQSHPVQVSRHRHRLPAWLP